MATSATSATAATTATNNEDKSIILEQNLSKDCVHDFRSYENVESRVLDHYRLMRKNQTVAFYRKMEAKYSFENGAYRRLMTIEEAFAELEHYVDASDPDLDLPNKMHLLQTAEGIRRAGHPDWMQLTGLVHDMGKIMFLWGTQADGQQGTAYGDQWALGGDTWVVGCAIPDHAVILPQYNTHNPDRLDPRYNTPLGMYTTHGGLDQLLFAWGHDEYMYRMLRANETCSLPKEALDMIRYHSAYPLHDKNAYHHLLKEEDHERLEWVRLFNQFDLYTKDGSKDSRVNVEELWPYYRALLEKYGLDGALKW